MKKTFAVVLAVMMLVVAFAGCGKKAVEPSTSPAATEETVTSPEATTEAPATTEEAPVTSEDAAAPVASPAA